MSKLHEEIQTTIDGFESDHCYQGMEVDVREPTSETETLIPPDAHNSESKLKIRGMTWNLMNICHDDSELGYSNNPFNINETLDNYQARKQLQINRIINLIKQRRLDYFCLQEVDFLNPHPKSSNEFQDVCKQLQQQLRQELKQLGYTIDISLPSKSQQLLATIYNKKEYDLISSTGVLPNANGKNRGYQTVLQHKRSQQQVAIINAHLDFSFDHMPDLQPLLSSEMTTIICGDLNRAANEKRTVSNAEVTRPLEYLIGDWTKATNLDRDKSGAVTTESQDFVKRYDGFMVNPGHSRFAVATEMGGTNFERITTNPNTFRVVEYRTDHPHHVTLIGKPWQRRIYQVRDLMRAYCKKPDPQLQQVILERTRMIRGGMENVKQRFPHIWEEYDRLSSDEVVQLRAPEPIAAPTAATPIQQTAQRSAETYVSQFVNLPKKGEQPAPLSIDSVTKVKGPLNPTHYATLVSNDKKVVLIFPGNPSHHQNNTLYSTKGGSGLATVSMNINVQGFPSLSLPTTRVANIDRPITSPEDLNDQKLAVVKRAVQDLWRAAGYGCRFILPVRDPGKDKTYFDATFPDKTEPSMWGKACPTPNIHLANFYLQELIRLERFMNGDRNFTPEDTSFIKAMIPSFEEGQQMHNHPTRWCMPMDEIARTEGNALIPKGLEGIQRYISARQNELQPSKVGVPRANLCLRFLNPESTTHSTTKLIILYAIFKARGTELKSTIVEALGYGNLSDTVSALESMIEAQLPGPSALPRKNRLTSIFSKQNPKLRALEDTYVKDLINGVSKVNETVVEDMVDKLNDFFEKKEPGATPETDYAP